MEKKITDLTNQVTLETIDLFKENISGKKISAFWHILEDFSLHTAICLLSPYTDINGVRKDQEISFASFFGQTTNLLKATLIASGISDDGMVPEEKFRDYSTHTVKVTEEDFPLLKETIAMKEEEHLGGPFSKCLEAMLESQRENQLSDSLATDMLQFLRLKIAHNNRRSTLIEEDLIDQYLQEGMLIALWIQLEDRWNQSELKSATLAHDICKDLLFEENQEFYGTEALQHYSFLIQLPIPPEANPENITIFRQTYPLIYMKSLEYMAQIDLRLAENPEEDPFTDPMERVQILNTIRAVKVFGQHDLFDSYEQRFQDRVKAAGTSTSIKAGSPYIKK